MPNDIQSLTDEINRSKARVALERSSMSVRTATVTTGPSASKQLLTANPQRISLILGNPGAAQVTWLPIQFSNTASGIPLAAGQSIVLSYSAHGAVVQSDIWVLAGSGIPVWAIETVIQPGG